MQTLTVAMFLVAALLAVVWLGLQVRPKPFTMPALQKSEAETVPVPAGLPEPVERFYRNVYGERIPIIASAVFTGRARIRPFGVWLPARFVFVHNASRDYRHYIEATFFGLPFLKVNEGYLDGESFFESPMGTYHNDPNTNQGANLALWAEAGWFPAIWATDSRIRWEGVDDCTALLHVPFEDETENFVVRFNPQTGFIDTMKGMRYRDPGEGQRKILWIVRNEKGATLPGMGISAVGSATWLDQGRPWAVFTLEAAAYNVDIQDYIRQRGR